MSTAATSRPAVDQGEGFNPWHRRAGELAEWVDRMMVNRRDAFGHYIAVEHRIDPDLTAWTDKSKLTTAVIERHLRTIGTGDLIGLHSTVRDEPTGEDEIAQCWSRWLAVDIDRHGDDGDPDTNMKVAEEWYGRASTLGFVPLLLDSNGRGGFHLILLFDAPVPTEKVYALGQWLTHDWKALGLTEAPETFPRQAEIAKGGFGNWLRLFGRHHTRDHYTRVWSGTTWLEGAAAVAAILGTNGASVDAIPAKALKPKLKPAGKPKKPVKFDPKSDAALAGEALRFVQHMADGYQEWLRIGMSLTPLGIDGLRLWDPWSYPSPKYEEGACERKWRSFTRNGVGNLTLGTLFYEAKQSGWPGQRTAPVGTTSSVKIFSPRRTPRKEKTPRESPASLSTAPTRGTPSDL